MREGEGSILGTFELKKLLKSDISISLCDTQLVSRKFIGFLRIICYVWENNKGRDRTMFRVHFGKLRKNDFKSIISFNAPTNLP